MRAVIVNIDRYYIQKTKESAVTNPRFNFKVSLFNQDGIKPCIS
jgi:hypothetical protein